MQRFNPYARPPKKGANCLDSGTRGKGVPGDRGGGGNHQGGGGNHQGGGGNHQGREGNHPSSWYKVTIPHGGKYDKKWLLTELENICSVPYAAVQYHLVRKRVHFFVSDATTAAALKKCSRKITDSYGYKVIVRVNRCAPPLSRRPNLKPEDLEHLKDGNGLPPPTGSDMETPTTSTPQCQDSNISADDLKALIQRFLLHYYRVYDSGDRQPLLDAYHNGATFSLSTDQQDPKTRKDSTTPNRQSKHTRLNVVAFLKELPKTQHNMASFNVELNSCTNTLLSFTVSGLFKAEAVDGESREVPMAFSRVFTAIPAANSGLCVVNDELQIRMATTEENRRQEMLTAFSLNSGMNLEWSKKCLQDNGWDFNRAAQVFTLLKTEGKIPDVAFIK